MAEFMNWVDGAILMICGCSGLLGIWQGAQAALLAWLGWVIAGAISLSFAPYLAALLATRVPVPSLALLVAMLILLLITLLLVTFVNSLLVSQLNSFSSAATEYSLGGLFGLMRGGMIITLLVLIASLTRLPSLSWWQHSQFLSDFEQIACLLRGFAGISC